MHGDFTEIKDTYSYKFIAIGKKWYCDLLKNDKGETAIHYRMKGIDLNCVALVANERYQGDTENERIYTLYRNLYMSRPIEFDLAKTKVIMEFTKDQRVRNKNKMERCLLFGGIKMKYEEN